MVCDETVGVPGVMADTIGAFFAEIASSRPARIESIGSRLTRRLN